MIGQNVTKYQSYGDVRLASQMAGICLVSRLFCCLYDQQLYGVASMIAGPPQCNFNTMRSRLVCQVLSMGNRLLSLCGKIQEYIKSTVLQP